MDFSYARNSFCSKFAISSANQGTQCQHLWLLKWLGFFCLFFFASTCGLISLKKLKPIYLYFLSVPLSVSPQGPTCNGQFQLNSPAGRRPYQHLRSHDFWESSNKRRWGPKERSAAAERAQQLSAPFAGPHPDSAGPAGRRSARRAGRSTRSPAGVNRAAGEAIPEHPTLRPPGYGTEAHVGWMMAVL